MKKTLLTAAVAAASFVGLTAFAGGGAVMPAQHNTFAYVELNTGFANKHLGQSIDSLIQLVDFQNSDKYTHSRTNGVWTVGGDLGYQFINNLAIELGGNWMQAARFTGPFNDNTNTTQNLNSWVAYLAGKMSVPVYDHLSVFAKAGLGYQRESGSFFDSANAEQPLSAQNSAWVPVFAVGANYDVNHNVFAGVQYMRFGSQIRSTDSKAWAFTAKDLFTASLGYKFQM